MVRSYIQERDEAILALLGKYPPKAIFNTIVLGWYITKSMVYDARRRAAQNIRRKLLGG